MGANVVTDEEAFSDVRFEILAGLCGFADADHARSKMERVWLWCVKNETDLAPVTVVSAILRSSTSGIQQLSSSIQQLLGPLDRGGCDLGEPVGDGHVRIKGCDNHRTFWFGGKRNSDKSAGGKARAASGSRGSNGRFASSAGHAGEPLDQQPSSSRPAAVQQPPAALVQQTPAAPASVSDLSEIPNARARSPEHGVRSTEYDLVVKLANEWRCERSDLVRRLQADGIDREAPGSGSATGVKGETDSVRAIAGFMSRSPTPSDPLNETPTDRARRIRRYVLEMLEVDARHNDSLGRLRETVAFDEKTVDWALNTTPSAIRADRPRSEWGKPAGAPARTIARKGPHKVGDLVDGLYRVEKGEV